VARALLSSVELFRSRFKTLEGELGDGPRFNGASFPLVNAAWAPVFRYFDLIIVLPNRPQPFLSAAYRAVRNRWSEGTRHGRGASRAARR
jgi:glutathione S-transferase